MLIPLIIGKMIGDAIGSANAAKAQEKQANAAMGLQRDIYGQQQRNYDQQRQDQMPWLDAGRQSLADLMRQMQAGGFDTRVDAASVANDPGYQFRMAEGQKALERSAAARGGLNGGGFMKGLANYSQGLASNEYQNAWNRGQTENGNRFNRLAQMAGIGQSSAQNLGSLGQAQSGQMANYANSMGNLYGALGNAQAGGAQAFPAAFGNGVNTMTNMFTTGVGAVAGMGGLGRMGGGGGMNIPQQGASTGYAGGYSPPYGFGLNYGGR